jgi:hypothetical protein
VVKPSGLNLFLESAVIKSSAFHSVNPKMGIYNFRDPDVMEFGMTPETAGAVYAL